MHTRGVWLGAIRIDVMLLQILHRVASDLGTWQPVSTRKSMSLRIWILQSTLKSENTIAFSYTTALIIYTIPILHARHVFPLLFSKKELNSEVIQTKSLFIMDLHLFS